MLIMENKYNLPDESHEFVHESWGGQWTETKLQAFEDYVKAYLNVMKYYRHKYNWKLFYFDGFAGSGTRSDDENIENTNKEINLFKDYGISHEELNVYRGAAERVASITDVENFDYFYFVEKDEKSRNNLKTILSKYNLTHVGYRLDANQEIKKLADAFRKNKKFKALMLLDPFGMQVNWESIQQLNGLSVDLFILIPTGVIINRLLDRKGKLNYKNKLSSFFGLSEDTIRNIFYDEVTENGLFGKYVHFEKIRKPIEMIANVYIDRLKTLFKYVSSQPLVLHNSRNVPIYHFAFATQNKTALKIAGQIIGKNQRK